MDDELKAFAEKVQPIYAMLGWTWNTDTVKGIPSADDIAYVIQALVDNMPNDGYVHTTTGGLYVQRDIDSGLVYGMEIRGGIYHT